MSDPNIEDISGNILFNHSNNSVRLLKNLHVRILSEHLT